MSVNSSFSLNTNVETVPKNLKLERNYEGLVLSGGGSKGIIQLGFLHNLFTQQMIQFEAINYFIGTSVGSIINFLLIINYTPVEILSLLFSDCFELKTPINFLNILSNFGIHSSDTIFTYISKLTEEKIGFIPTMNELYEMYGKVFVCVTHNLSSNPYNNEQNTVYVDYQSHPNLSCIEAIRMSSNIPLVFEKYIYDKNYYVDGGLSDNYPVEYACQKFSDTKLLGISVNNNYKALKHNEKITIVEYMKCIMATSYRHNNSRSCQYYNENLHSVIISIDDEEEVRFNIPSSKKFELFSIGYQSCKSLLNNSDLIKTDDETNKMVKTKLKLD
jgi:predicted acylesterase/phospholipase RssA